MKYNPIPLNVGLLDSLTIYLPIEKVKIIDERLTSDFCIYYPETGLLLEDLNPPKPVIINDNGVNFRFNKVVFPPKDNQPPQTLIRLTLTTKMLFERYFEGLNAYNIYSIIDYINSRNIINVDYETVLNSICNDIDICINYNLLFEPYKESLFFLKKMVKPSKQHTVTVFPRKQSLKMDKNYGIQFGERDRASIGTPFCKFYNKTNELLTHSVDFYNNYIFPQLRYGLNIDNLIRKEITLKNSASKVNLKKKKLVSDNNELKTLNDIFKITPQELTKICNIQLKYYFEKKQISVSEDLSPRDKALSLYMLKIVEKGGDKLELLEPLNLFKPEEKVQKSLLKKHLLKIMDVTFDTNYLQNKLTNNSISNQFIRLQQLW